MNKRASFAWLELFIGILLIALGVYSLLKPEEALDWAIVLYGIAAVVTGIMDIVFYVKTEHYIGFGPTLALVSGILSVLTGLMLAVYPGAARLAFLLLFPIWFIAHCVSRLSTLSFVRLTAGERVYVISLVMNIIGLILGVLMLFQPGLSIQILRAISGIYLISLGLDGLIRAIGHLRSGG